ncbi:MAG TPA: dienelactone hydrolase [Cyanothece sp. UBA12306]|nr:dienelactone hydrolase [Cyanothece sp. UBA12306]
MKSSRTFLPLILKLVGGFSTLCLFLGNGLISSASAAEKLTFKLGPLQHTIQIDDLQQFVNTGNLSPKLKPYQFVLTPQVQELLGKHIQVDPIIAEQFLADLFQTVDGDKLLQQINQALPNSTRQQLKLALQLLVQQTSNLSIINFLRVYPQETLTIDLSSLASLAVQFNASFIQSQLLNSRLEKALKSPQATIVNHDFDPTAKGDNIVYQNTFVVRDRSRQRNIPLDIYYGNNTHGSLVVLSHGFASNRYFLRYLARHLASHGLTVVSIEHPGSDINALIETSVGLKISEILPSSEFVDRPQDVSFVLNQLSLIDQKNSHFKGKFNTQEVTIIGHSFGGYTALALAGATVNLKVLRQFCQEINPVGRSPADWLQCAAAKLPYSSRRFKDLRVKRVIALNPIVGQLFANNLSQINVPTLILSGSEDSITPTISHQLQPFKQLTGTKYLIMAFGATHMSITDVNNYDSSVAQSTLVREVIGQKAEPVRQLVKGVSLAFIQQLNSQSSEYDSFLTSGYVESLSNDKIRFRLTTKFSSNIENLLKVLVIGKQTLTISNLPSFNSTFYQIKNYFSNAKDILIKPEYCTTQVNDLFTKLLTNYPHS